MFSREIKSVWSEGWLYGDELVLIIVSFEGLKGKLQVWS